MTIRNTQGLRIRTKCRTIDELVAWFHRFCDEKSIFIATPTPRPKGFSTTFSLDLATGEPAFAGEGIVIATWSTGDNRFRQPGMQIQVCSVSAESARVLEQLLVARAVALDSAQSRELSRDAWEEGTEVSAPMFHEPAAAPSRATPPANKTMLGIPSIRLPATPATGAAAVPVTAAGASSPKLGPNAFTFSAPAPAPAPARVTPAPARLPGVAAYQPKPDPETDALPMPPAPTLAKSSSPQLAPPAGAAAHPDRGTPLARAEESVSTRVPRAGTELGSGPVARAPARVVESVSYDQDVPMEDDSAVAVAAPAVTWSAELAVNDELTVAQAAMPLPMDRPVIARDAVGSLHNDFVQGGGNTMQTRPASVAQAPSPSESPRPRRRRSLAVALGALALAGAAVVGVVMMRGSGDEQAPAAAKPVAAFAPAAEQRVVEQPAAAQAAVEQPAAEQPAAEQPAPEPAVKQPAVEQPAVAAAPTKAAKTAALAKPAPTKRTATKSAKRTTVKRVAAKPSPAPKKSARKKKTCASLDCL